MLKDVSKQMIVKVNQLMSGLCLLITWLNDALMQNGTACLRADGHSKLQKPIKSFWEKWGTLQRPCQPPDLSQQSIHVVYWRGNWGQNDPQMSHSFLKVLEQLLRAETRGDVLAPQTESIFVLKNILCIHVVFSNLFFVGKNCVAVYCVAHALFLSDRL